ncbi:MAG: UPF0262 family protein [Alphaproteobacteria bacterium]|nr:UPF0262 family protein [Alphaproteobacteria bacterium]
MAEAIAQPTADKSARMVHISLNDPALVARNPDIEHERRVAIFDLIEGNHFALVEGPKGPYRVVLSVVDRGILFSVSNSENESLAEIELAMTPFRRNIRDYFMICESYFEAIRTATPERIEEIDQARRALHNESAELLENRLSPHVEVDDDTARRLFTLISVLKMRS